MESKIWIVIILFSFAVLLSGCFSAPQPPATTDNETAAVNNTPSGNATPPAAKTVIVNITSSGFSPGTITINSGDTITFVNTDTSLHWVASKPHPIHTDVPGFDARKALQRGESYSFTFTKKGTFGCHDHLNPATMCAIIVQ